MGTCEHPPPALIPYASCKHIPFFDSHLYEPDYVASVHSAIGQSLWDWAHALGSPNQALVAELAYLEAAATAAAALALADLYSIGYCYAGPLRADPAAAAAAAAAAGCGVRVSAQSSKPSSPYVTVLLSNWHLLW